MKKIAWLLCIVMCLALFSACGSSDNPSGSNPGTSNPSTSTPSGQTGTDITYRELKVGNTDGFCVGHFDVSTQLNNSYNAAALQLVYDHVVNVNPVTGEIESDILSDFHWDDEQCAVVLTLKDNVYFSNGDKMDAEDIQYTFQRQSKAFMYVDKYMIMLINESTISDDGLTLTIPFSEPCGTWRSYLGGNSGVMNKDWILAHGGDDMDFYDYTLVSGSGPYVVTEFVVDNYTVFERNENWWMKDSISDSYCAYDKITVYYYTDMTTLMVDYETGAIDLAVGISNSDYSRIKADPSLGTAVEIPSNFVAALVLDSDNSALSDINLRKALCYGIDTSVLTKLAYGELGSPATSTIPSTFSAYISGNAYEYNPELAKQIVDENGLAGTTLNWVATAGTTATLAEAVQGMMSKIGINIKLDIVDFATATGMWMTPGATNFQLDGSSFNNDQKDPHSQYQMLLGTQTFPCCAKSDAELNRLLNAARGTVVDSERDEYYKQIQTYLYENFYEIPICEWNYAACYGSSIAGATLGDATAANYRFVTPAN